MTQVSSTSLRKSVENFAEKYNFDKCHAIGVENIALKLFQSLRHLHNLGNYEKSILSCASLLHDIGYFINKKKHHKHTMYLIKNDKDLDFLAVEERYVLSLITYNHRKKIHKSTYELPLQQKSMVLILSSILRIADSLLYDNDSTEIRKISADNKKVVIDISGDVSKDLREKFDEKKNLFIEIFKKNIILSSSTVL